MKEKRSSKKGSNPKKQNLVKDELLVQQLSSELSGRAQKYTQLGLRKFIPYKDKEVTFDNIMAACEKFFKSKLRDNMCCDILAGEQGLSCRTLDQTQSESH